MTSDKKGFKKLVDPDRALEIFFKDVRLEPVGTEEVPITQALNRVLAGNIVSNVEIPPFDRAAMDGYAVRSMDVSGASDTNPIRLKVIGESKTGMPFDGVVDEGEAVRIDTGAEMPDGADAVVMVEYTRLDGEHVDIYRAASPHQNVALKGEDVRKGDIVAYGGIPLTPYDLAAIASLGFFEVKVYKKPLVGIAAIGNELVEIGGSPGRSEIIETNRIMLRGILRDYPVDILDYGIVSDDPDMLISFFERAINEVDFLITAGGTSMGKGDYVVEAIKHVGRVFVHGVALFPSRPVVLAESKGKPILGLPGYPVAAAISTYIFGDAIINRLIGIDGHKIVPEVGGKLTRRAPSKLGLRHYVRGKIVRADGELLIEPTITSGAGILTSLSLSDGYIVIDEDVEGYEAGDEVRIQLYRRYVK